MRCCLLYMNEITLALTRFWQNKQISLPPMSTLLIAAGIMFFCFWVVTSQKQKEQEERAKARKNVFQNLDAAIAAAPICEHIPCRTNPAKFYFLGVQTGIISEQEDAGILCSYLTYLDADRSSHLAAAFRQVIFAAL